MVTTRGARRSGAANAQPEPEKPQREGKENQEEVAMMTTDEEVVVASTPKRALSDANAEASLPGERIKSCLKETCDNLVKRMSLSPSAAPTDKSEGGVLTLGESLQLLPGADTRELCAHLRAQAQEACAEPRRQLSSARVAAVTHLAKLAREIIRQKQDEKQQAREAWQKDLHEAACLMHNRVLLYTPPAYDDGEEAAAEEAEEVADAHATHLCENAVALLCETWVTRFSGDAGAEEDVSELAARTLPWLLVQALTRSDEAAFARRATKFALQALPFFDWSDDSATSLKRLLLRALFCPPFVRSAQGRKMLARCFALDPDFSSEMMAVIRNQLLAGRNSLAESYGDILFQAWKSLAVSVSAAEAETVRAACAHVLQQEICALVQACLLARTPKLSDMLRRLLRSMLYVSPSPLHSLSISRCHPATHS